MNDNRERRLSDNTECYILSAAAPETFQTEVKRQEEEAIVAKNVKRGRFLRVRLHKAKKKAKNEMSFDVQYK